MTDISQGIGLFEDIFINASFFDTLMVPQLIVVIVTLLIITREVNEWKSLGLPVMLGWNVFGMYISPILLLFAGVLFAIENVSSEVISGGLNILKSPIKGRETYGTISPTKVYGARKLEKARKKEIKLWKEIDRRTKQPSKLTTNLTKMSQEKFNLVRSQLTPMQLENILPLREAYFSELAEKKLDREFRKKVKERKNMFKIET